MSANLGKYPGSIAALGDGPAGIVRLFEQRRSKITFDCIPSRIDGLLTVERILSGHALAPAFRAVGMKRGEQDAPLGCAPEAGLEKMHQRHADLAQGDGFNSHGCSSDQCPSR